MRVHDSQAYRKMDVTRECISRILELREILLSSQTGFSLVSAAVVCAILAGYVNGHNPRHSAGKKKEREKKKKKKKRTKRREILAPQNAVCS